MDESTGTEANTKATSTSSTQNTPDRSRSRRRMGRATATLALLLIPFVVQVAPVGAAGSLNLRLYTQSSPATTVGLQIFANLNLLGGSTTPTGSATFELFSPVDPTCSTPIFVSTVPVTTTSVNSARFTTTQAGTYRWQSSYSGDATYAAAGPTPCDDQGGQVIVGKASTYIQTTAGASPAEAAEATVALNGGFLPTGTLTYLLTGPDDVFCSRTPVHTTTKAVHGSGTYASGPFVPPASGEYKWRSIYSGDNNNLGYGPTACLHEGASQIVNLPTTVPPPTAVDGGSTDRAQMTMFRPSTGVWYIRDASGSATIQVQWGRDGDVPVAADYNGDGRVDLAVYRPSTGRWMVKGVLDVVYGGANDIPIPGDYDGNGTADVAVWRPATGQWFVRGLLSTVWGTEGDVPVPGDYDGNGTTDVGVYRPTTRQWLVRGIVDVIYGRRLDRPVPADYNGDGRTDIAVWRPSIGTWFVLGILQSVLGEAGDIPQPGDYDGDGSVDTAVYGPTTGEWSLQQTTDGLVTRNLGTVGDVATSAVSLIWNQVTGLYG